MAFERTEYPKWSWSASRKSTFTECLRKYYFNYYLAHNGWEKNAPEDSKRIYRLKNLSGFHLVLGTAIHEAAEDIIKQIQADPEVLLDEVSFQENVKQAIGEYVSQSIEIRDPLGKIDEKEWEVRPKKFKYLFEFYKAKGNSREEIIKAVKDGIGKKIETKRITSVKNMISCSTFKNLRESSVTNVLAENMDTFQFIDDDGGETEVWAIPDLVYDDNKDGQKVIVDWKTGKSSDEHQRQVNIYAKYFQEKDGADINKIIGRIEYLTLGKVEDILVSEDSVTDTCKMINDSIAEMKKYVINCDTEKNQPMSIDDFPLTSDTKFCPWCSFYEVCYGK